MFASSISKSGNKRKWSSREDVSPDLLKEDDSFEDTEKLSSEDEDQLIDSLEHLKTSVDELNTNIKTLISLHQTLFERQPISIQ